jgi:3-oxoacyl-[acyl-carrier protein] reductase
LLEGEWEVDLGIRGRKAIVNGGSAGLGRGTALALGREGVELFVTARGGERLLRTCEHIRGTTGARVTPVVADHSTSAGRARILEACPNPDILVATCTPPPFIEDFTTVTEDDWRANLELTLISPVEMMKAIIPGMVERGFGRIVNIATGAAKFPVALRVLSGPPRAALVNYSVAVARQVAQHNVTVNCLLPIMHDTDGIREIFAGYAAERGTTVDQEIADAVRAMGIPAGRFGNAEDFGAMAAMFCSAQANYVSGQSLVVDGGYENSTF